MIPFRMSAEIQRVEALIRSDVIDPADEEQLAALIDGESNIPELAALIIEQINEDLGLVEGIEAAEARLKARRERINARAERNKDVLFTLAGRLNVKSMQTAVGTFGRTNRTRLVYDAEQIPAAWFKQPPPVLDKAAIQAAVKAGEDVPGVTSESYQTLFLKV